ncbi:hypothetical protein ACH4TV_44010 [Streptomyces sp. NPDC020898]|uniref:hypothetical protein n=1 Tax=Streptomyces sp. NPDC020898 TaxID=3365101 RepID=UPI0037B3DBF9
MADRQGKAKLLHLERRAARRKQHRKPGERTSRRLHRTYDPIAGLRAKAKHRALDWQHRTTTAIAHTYGTVVGEALTVTNMVKNPDCGWSGNADHNAARNVLHLYRMGLALILAAGRAVVRRAKRVKPATAR